MTGSLRPVARWVARQDGAVLELVCVEHPAPALGDPARTVVRAGTCLADVPAHEVLELLTAGAQTVVVRRDGCEQPAAANVLLDEAVSVLVAAGIDRLQLSGPATATEAQPEVAGPEVAGPEAARPEAARPDPAGPARRGLGRRRARPPRQVRREVLDAEHMPVPRRQVLGLGSGPAPDLADEHAPAPQRLTAALAALLPTPPGIGPQLLAPAVRLRAKGCTACGVCVRACPTDALVVRHLGGTGDAGAPTTQVTTLLQNPTSCDGCQSCVQICPEDVLGVAGQWDWETLVLRAAAPTLAPVASLTTAQCQRCRTRFPTTESATLCPVCAYRRQNPFASRLPPGMAPGV